MAKVDLEDHERIARAATQGEWTALGEHLRIPEYCTGFGIVSDVQCVADAQHIAANSPPVTLALIARIRRLETELARASGCARAGGRHVEADEFLRVAMDREVVP